MVSAGEARVPRRYLCRRAESPLVIDGSVSGPGWSDLAWTEDFVDITGSPVLRPRFRTRVRMAWDDKFFYVGADMEEPHVWGTITEKNAVMFEDNDFEVFIDPDGDGLDYYEFEINALGSIWELSLPRPYGEGGVPVLGCNLPGLQSAVQVRGTVNDPSDEDEGWSVAVAFPWAGLARFNKERPAPPQPRTRTAKQGRDPMKILFKLILILVVLGAIGLAGYAYLGDMSPTQEDISQPVILDGA